ncbi:MAG: zinc dependent phospholipase [Firmicutes bacterium]|nr:zinc dependent phospholipase [Bacillota bacterium]
MGLHIVNSSLLIGGGLKLLLQPAGLFQGLIDRPGVVHPFCNRQALVILRNDGYKNMAAFFEQYLPELNRGVYWADDGWKNVGHYLEAGTRKGLWRFPNAIDDFREYFGRALQHVRRGDWRKATFFLGAAAHLVQDVCVPQHACGKLLSGHRQYEAWVGQNYPRFAVSSTGIYGGKTVAHSLLIKNAEVAANFLSWVGKDASREAYSKATAVLLERAQRTTAGLFLQFYQATGVGVKAA